MTRADFDIHGVKVCLHGVSRFALRDFNLPWMHFASPATHHPDIEVHLGPFTPDRENCAQVDHRYFARPGHLSYAEEDKGMRWSVEIDGMTESSPLQVKFHATGVRRKFPWALFPDLPLHLYVLQPLLEWKLGEQGRTLFHAAAVEHQGRAMVFAGRGGSHKTSLAMAFVRRGGRLLGDDFVVLEGERVLPFPTIPGQFDFLLRHCPSESLTRAQQFRLAAHLAWPRSSSTALAGSTPVDSWNLLYVHEGHDAVLRADVDGESALEALALNQEMERNTYVGFRHSMTSFLEAYDYLCGLPSWRRVRAGLRPALRAAIGERAVKAWALPRLWDSGLAARLAAE